MSRSRLTIGTSTTHRRILGAIDLSYKEKPKRRTFGRRSSPVVLGAVLSLSLSLGTRSYAFGAICSVGSSGDYATIGGAVGDTNCTTINVAAGTYIEQLTITRSLGLHGAGAGTSIIQVPTSLPAGGDLLTVSGAITVEIDNFTLTGPGPSSCGSIRHGIYVIGGATVNIHHNALADIRDQYASGGVSGCQNGVAIRVGRQADATTGTATISNNLITGYQKGGVVVDNIGSSATITNNVVTFVNPGPNVIAANGIQISRGATATVSGNMVSGNACDNTGSNNGCGDPSPLTGTHAVGILLYLADPSSTIVNNTVTGNDEGIYNLVCDGCSGSTTISGNVVQNNRYVGIDLDQGKAAVSGNDVRGGDIGINELSFLGNTLDTFGTVTCNRIEGNTAGIELLDDSTSDSAIPLIHANSNVIAGNSANGVNNTTMNGAIDTTGNWWGCATGPGNAGCDSVTGQVNASSPATSPPACVTCLGAPNSAACSDGDATTTGDACKNGVCIGCTANAWNNNGVCTPLTVCTASQYQSVAPTATTDRVCTALTTCTASQYQSVAPTATTDRVCTACATNSLCQSGLSCTGANHQGEACGGGCAANAWNNSGVCTALTTCTTAQYQSAAPTATSNRMCAACTICPTGTATTSACTATSNTVCSACPAGQFQNQVGQPSCAVCPVGQVQPQAGQVSCVTCPAGTQPNATRTQCMPIATPTPSPTPTPTATPTATRPPDRDGDGVLDASDDCPTNWNPAQSGGHIGDMCNPTFTLTPFVLQKVTMKAAGIGRDGRATMVIKGILDTTEWGGATAFAGVLKQGVAVHVDGAGLAVPGQTINFAPCTSVCVGSGPVVAKFARKNRRTPDLLTVKMTIKGRTFAPPLTAAPVAVTLSLGGRDRRDQIGTCHVGRYQSTANCSAPR